MVLVDIATIALTAIGILLLFPVAVLLIEIVASFWPARESTPVPARRPMAVLVPAHDEELTVGAAVAGILPELGPDDRLLVVADNCTDATAALARAAGAEVIVRTDGARRGKGFALDFGVRHLEADPPAVVVIVDADCRPAPGSLPRIAGLAAATQRPVQAHYDIMLPEGPHSTLRAFVRFALRVKNFARPLGCRRLGLACQLTGSGMAFPWALIGRANLATSEIVEDLVYGLELTRDGHPPLFCPDALVTSEFPVAVEGQRTQRARWETGHLHTIAKRLPGLLWDAVARRDLVLLALVLDAAVPPLAFLAAAIAAFTVLGGVVALVGGAAGLLALAAVTCLLFTMAVLLAWWRVGRDVLSLYELVLAPGYVLSKLGFYCRILAGQKIGWVRSKRNPH